MKAKKVLDLLEITRKTLNGYVKSGRIRVKKLDNGFYEYNEADVAKICACRVKTRRILVFEPGNRIEITSDFPGYDALVDYILRTIKS